MLLHVVLSHIVLSQNMFRVMTVQGLWVLYSLITSLLFVGLVLRQADKITNGTSRKKVINIFPENLLGTVDFASDIWSFRGVIDNIKKMQHLFHRPF